MTGGARVLLVDDDAALREVVSFQLADAGFQVVVASSGDDALLRFEPGQFEVVLTDLRMPGRDGLELLRAVRQRDEFVSVVIVTAFASVDAAVAAVRDGAHDFLVKPVAKETLLVKLGKAAAQTALLREHRDLRRRVETSERRPLLHASPAMEALLDQVRRVAPSDVPLLLQGESGTGKELIAREIHRLSTRKGGPFLAVNCAAIPGDLLEAELFGHGRGAFTGADRAREGRFRAAEGGTMLLDEIGDLPLSLQPKLLRVLQERAVEPVGSSHPLPIDVRVIAATHRDLPRLVAAGAFREDLYYRVAGLPLRVPPLRERPEDIGLLFSHFLQEEARHAGRTLSIGPGLVEALRQRSWPGNVRQLENLARQLALLVPGPSVEVRDLPAGPAPSTLVPAEGPRAELRVDVGQRPYLVVLPDTPFVLPELEEGLVRAALERHGGNQSAAARALGVPRHVLLYRLEKFGILPD